MRTARVIAWRSSVRPGLFNVCAVRGRVLTFTFRLSIPSSIRAFDNLGGQVFCLSYSCSVGSGNVQQSHKETEIDHWVFVRTDLVARRVSP